MTKKAELVGSHYPTIYLTVISLLQGIALSQLVPNIITYLEMADHPLTDVRLLPLLLMLLAIFIVWHHYAIGIFFLRWFPNIIDTVIPFFVSIGQFILISFITIKDSVDDIDVSTWMKGFSVFILFGSLPYLVAAFRLDPDLFTNIMSKANAVAHCQRTKRIYIWSGCSILFQGIFAFVIAWLGYQSWLLGSLLFFIMHLVLSEYFQLRDLKPAFIRSMDEFDEIS